MNSVLAPVDTKTRILDAAERIFSQDGFDAASLRTITAAALVNLAAVNYHFQTKEALFSAVIERRVQPVNRRRIEMLEEMTGKPSVEKILEAFLRPVLESKSGEPAILRPLMARLHGVPRELHTRIIEDNFAPVMQRFVDALTAALPGAPPDELKWRLFFLIGSMTQTMAWGPIMSKFIDGDFNPNDVETLMARLVSFGAAGIKRSNSPRSARAVSSKLQSTKRVNH
jgi:AcrR family transcriptional regulator